MKLDMRFIYRISASSQPWALDLAASLPSFPLLAVSDGTPEKDLKIRVRLVL